MGLFDFFVRLNYKGTDSWVETTATFTGRRNKAAGRTKVGYSERDYYEYEISYFDGKKKRRGYYSFYPLPDPDIEEIEGKTMKIKYNEKKPFEFKAVV